MINARWRSAFSTFVLAYQARQLGGNARVWDTVSPTATNDAPGDFRRDSPPRLCLPRARDREHHRGWCVRRHAGLQRSRAPSPAARRAVGRRVQGAVLSDLHRGRVRALWPAPAGGSAGAGGGRRAHGRAHVRPGATPHHAARRIDRGGDCRRLPSLAAVLGLRDGGNGVFVSRDAGGSPVDEQAHLDRAAGGSGGRRCHADAKPRARPARRHRRLGGMDRPLTTAGARIAGCWRA